MGMEHFNRQLWQEQAALGLLVASLTSIKMVIWVLLVAAAYFGRYRVRLKTRADIAGLSGISDADRVAMRLALR